MARAKRRLLAVLVAGVALVGCGVSETSETVVSGAPESLAATDSTTSTTTPDDQPQEADADNDSEPATTDGDPAVTANAFEAQDAIDSVEVWAAAFEAFLNAEYADSETFYNAAVEVVHVFDPALLPATLEVSGEQFYECYKDKDPQYSLVEWVDAPVVEFKTDHVEQIQIDADTWIVRTRLASEMAAFELDSGFGEPVNIIVTRDGLGPAVRDVGSSPRPCFQLNETADQLIERARQVLAEHDS